MKKYLPLLCVALMALPFLSSFRVPADSNGFHLNDFARLPALQNGRVKPLDTIARNALLVIHGSQSLRENGRKVPAREWLLEVMADGQKADERKLFRIYDEDILGLIHQEVGSARYYSYRDLAPHLRELADASTRAEQLESANRSRFQKAVVQLARSISIYRSLKNTLFLERTAGEGMAMAANTVEETEGFLDNLATVRLLWAQTHMHTHEEGSEDASPVALLVERYGVMMQFAHFHILPPLPGESADEWRSMGRAFMETIQGDELHPLVMPMAKLVEGYRSNQPEMFNQAVADIQAGGSTRAGMSVRNGRWEYLFNLSQPFYQGILIYVVVMMLIFISWLAWGQPLTRSAYVLLLLGFAVHTFGLVMRIYLQGRPPVTNLYSSALFVGWIAVLIGVFLERIFKNGFATLGTSIVGSVTLVIAHHLSMGGDTMEMMQAVLDSNFWLSTHVVTITIGYGASFVAGILAHIAIIKRFFRPNTTSDSYRSLARMTYGVVCFSLFLSFVGTTLGGIWADQSWGRFWGWDPKENGALMIVLWYAVVLHARMAGLIRERGLLVMAVFGCIVTSFSWFGVNMLGIGLHSYGFMDKAFYWLVGFMVLEAVVMLIGLQPQALSTDDKTIRP